MNNLVTCPHCKKGFEMSQAFKHEIEEQIRHATSIKHKEELQKLEKDIEEQLKGKEREIEEARKKAFEDAQKKVAQEIELKLKDAANENDELRVEKKELMEQVLQMNKQVREMREIDEKRQIENEKRINESIEKMRGEISKTETDKARLQVLELEKKLTDTTKLLEDAQRKTQQGSQQLQGEVMELDLEARLKECFPSDKFLPVPKGVDGADIIQKIYDAKSGESGIIVWELKRTKSFSKPWLAKLREDTRSVNGSMSILVSDVLPEGVTDFDCIEGVWVTSFDHAQSIAFILRSCLVKIARTKVSDANKDEKLQVLYQYITSEAFRHKIEAHFESVKTLQVDLESEKRLMERVWKKREIQLQRLDRSASQLFGELQGILGSSLPTVKSLDGVDDLLDVTEQRLLD